MANQETNLLINDFGTVTDKRVVLNRKSGVEEIVLKNVTSVQLKHERSYFFSFGGFAVAIACLVFMFSMIEHMPGTAVLIVVIMILIGILSGFANWVGHHNIIVGVGGVDRKPLKVELAKTKQGREFVDAIKKAIKMNA